MDVILPHPRAPEAMAWECEHQRSMKLRNGARWCSDCGALRLEADAANDAGKAIVGVAVQTKKDGYVWFVPVRDGWPQETVDAMGGEWLGDILAARGPGGEGGWWRRPKPEDGNGGGA